MKQTLLGFFLAIILIVGVSATTTSLMTVKPAIPISTVCYNGSNPEDFTIKYAKSGYQVISSASCGYYDTYVVMVKY